MINQEIEMFMRFDLPQAFREKFYPEMFKYFKFILPNGDFYVHSNERGSFKEELEVFRLINVMISGICSNNNIKFPIAMFSPDVEKFVAKLKASLK